MSDSILRNRVWSRMQAGVDEAEVVFRSGSGSAALCEGETAIGLFSADGHLLVEGSTSAPYQAALLRVWIQAIQDRIDDGEGAWVSNDPYDGGGSICDLKMVAPVQTESGVLWVAVTGHYSDLGGKSVGGVAPGARRIHEEGLRIPFSRLDEHLTELLSANCRYAGVARQDLAAQKAALRALAEWMSRLADIHGWGAIDETCVSVYERAVSARVKACRDLTEGVYVRRDRLDDDVDVNAATSIKLTLGVEGSGLVFDFEGTGAQAAGPSNCTYASTIAAILCGLRQIFPEIPACGFGIDGLEIRVPHGSLLNAVYPAAVGGTFDVVGERVSSVVIEALSQAVHGRGKACDGGGGNVIVIESDAREQAFALRLVVGSGGGASGRGDGLSNSDPANRLSDFPSIEAIERTLPVRVIRHAEREGSGGAGRYRGGEGTVFEIASLERQARLSVYADRYRRGAGGHHRGSRGQTAEIQIHTNGHWQVPENRGRSQDIGLDFGDRVRIATAGGGGYGHPYERAIRLVSEDVTSGRLSRTDAAKRHGVVFTSDSASDYDSGKTFKLRSYRLTSSDVDDFLDEIEALKD